MNTKYLLETPFRWLRFNIAVPYILGPNVLDIGCHDSKLKEYLPKSVNYIGCEFDYSIFYSKKFDTIVLLAVIEHIEPSKLKKMFKMLSDHLYIKGRIVITTPTKKAKKILDILAKFKLLEPKGIEEHKYYLTKTELLNLGVSSGFKLYTYKLFEFGFNQLIVFEK